MQTLFDKLWESHLVYEEPGAPALLLLSVDNVGDVEWQSVRAFPTPGRTWSAGLTPGQGADGATTTSATAAASTSTSAAGSGPRTPGRSR